MSRASLVRILRKARLIPAPRSICAHLAAGALILLIGLTRTARATDYGASGGRGGISTSTHLQVNFNELAGTGTMGAAMCGGESGCCCVAPPDSNCCHHATTNGFHQTCCSTNGPPGNECTGDSGTNGICGVKITRARLCLAGSNCTFPENQVAVICDDGDPSNLCPAAGTRLETTLTVGPNPGDDLEPLDLCSLHNGCLEIYVEFDNGADLALDVVGGPKDPPAGLDCSAPCATPIPAVSAWGLAGLCIALAAAAAAVIVRRNRRAAHNA